MFYKALGFVVWRLATAELRRRFSRRLRIAAVLGLAGIAAGGYVLARSNGE